MTRHLFGNVVTSRAIAANNRGENEGTVATLQKIVRSGEHYTTVSSESIRYAIREMWFEEDANGVNRTVSSQTADKKNSWKDKTFKNWQQYVDDDVLGFMRAKKEETHSRRGVLEIGRAVSLTPWMGTISHNFASPRSNPGETHGHPIPYQAEIHDTRYQYGFAMTPTALAQDRFGRTQKVMHALQNLRRVAGNHGRYLYDFSPELIVLRWTHDPAPRLLFTVDEDERGRLTARRLVTRIEGGDIDPGEVIVGTVVDDLQGMPELERLGVKAHRGIKAAVADMLDRIRGELQ